MWKIHFLFSWSNFLTYGTLFYHKFSSLMLIRVQIINLLRKNAFPCVITLTMAHLLMNGNLCLNDPVINTVAKSEQLKKYKMIDVKSVRETWKCTISVHSVKDLLYLNDSRFKSKILWPSIYRINLTRQFLHFSVTSYSL